MRYLSLLYLLIAIFFCLAVSGKAQEEAESREDLVPSTLLESVIKGDVDGISRALEAGENIDVVNENGWSGAMIAVFLGDLNVLNKLIDSGIDLNQPNNEGLTPLMLAAREADKESVELLLKGNASPLIEAGDGSTALAISQRAGRNVVTALIAEACVLHGIEREDADAVLQGVKDGAYVNMRNTAGWTPLMLATAQNRADVVEELLSMGAEVSRTENDGWTALHFAAQVNAASITSLLLAKGADPDAPSLIGRTPREIAQENGFLDVLELLPEKTPEL